MIENDWKEVAIRSQVFLEKLKQGEVNRYFALFKQLRSTIKRELSGEELTDFSRTRLNQQLAHLNGLLKKLFDDYQSKLKSSLIDIAENQAKFEYTNFKNSIPGVQVILPSSTQITSAIFSNPLSVRNYKGDPLLEPMLKNMAHQERQRLTGAIRQGAFEGQTNYQIIKNIVGTKKRNYLDGLLNISRNGADAIVRTSVQHVANTARAATWEANSDFITGYKWSSTLDGRTTNQCKSMDGETFKIKGGPLPPLHIRCRSTTVPTLNKKYDYLDEGKTRTSKDGYVEDHTYYEWLKKQPKNFQDQALGPVRGQLFRNGGLSVSEFAKLNLDKNFEPITLKEMAEIQPIAFEKAFGEDLNYRTQYFNKG